MPDLELVARESDRAVREARARLVDAVRQARREGLTQAEIAERTGRSQPEVHRLLRFHGSTPRARMLVAARRLVLDRVRAAGGRDVRVFGSVAAGTDGDDSDIDLLFEMRRPLGLLELAALERDVSELLDHPVDLVPESSLRAGIRERVLAEAVPL